MTRARLAPGPSFDYLRLMDKPDLGPSDSPKRKNDRSDSPIELLERANAKLKEQNRKLRELAEHRSASIAHLAHELRTPLTSIIGFAEIMLTQETLSEAQRNFCQRIQNSAHQLQLNLSQLGELSRLEISSDDDAPSE